MRAETVASQTEVSNRAMREVESQGVVEQSHNEHGLMAQPGARDVTPTDRAKGHGADAGPRFVLLREVGDEVVDWLWEPYLPLGGVTLLSGDPGSGTTYVALAIAAAITRGTAHRLADSGYVWDTKDAIENQRKKSWRGWPANVLYLGKGRLGQVVRPRFDTLEGDAGRLHAAGGSCPLEELEEAVRQNKPRLVIVDPIQSYVSEWRQDNWLERLERLAQECHCCVLLVRHLSKARTGRVMARTLGQLDLSGTVQSELLVGVSPYEEADRTLLHVRSEAGRCGPALGYTITAEGGFHWTVAATRSAQELLGPPLDHERYNAVQRAVSFLRRHLQERPVWAPDMVKLAKQEGIPEKTLRRAKQHLRVISRKEEDGGWSWVLPRLEVPSLGAGKAIPGEAVRLFTELDNRNVFRQLAAMEQEERQAPAAAAAAGAVDDNSSHVGRLGHLDRVQDFKGLTAVLAESGVSRTDYKRLMEVYEAIFSGNKEPPRRWNWEKLIDAMKKLRSCRVGLAEPMLDLSKYAG